MLLKYIALLDKLLPAYIGIPFLYKIILEFKLYLESFIQADPAAPNIDSEDQQLPGPAE